MKKIKVALIGLGRIASRLEQDPLRNKPCTHAGTILKSSIAHRFSLVGIWDENPIAIQTFMEDWKFKKPPVLLNPKKDDFSNIDLAVIATPTDSHYATARNLITKSVPNLLVEKPVTREFVQVKQLLALKKKWNFRLWVNHERRFHPVYNWAKQLIDSGKLGKIKTIHASVLTSGQNPGVAFSGRGGGPLLHDGTHAIDLIHWFIGSPDKITAKFHKSNPKYKIEEQAIVWMEYKTGENVFLEVGGYRKYFQFELDIQTTYARFILSNDGFSFFETKPSTLYKGFRSLIPSRIPKSVLKKPNPFPKLYQEIADRITLNQYPTTGSLKDNFEIMKIIDSIQKVGKFS